MAKKDPITMHYAELWRRVTTAESDAERLREALERARKLGERWVGLDESHRFGDELLTALDREGGSNWHWHKPIPNQQENDE
jgi:hypothetical protein